MYQLESSTSKKALIQDYLVAMALCHSVVTDVSETGEIAYKAPSPDEEALCDGARANQAELLERNSDGCRVRVLDEGEIFYEVVCELPFTSARRRMSVIIRCPDGSYVLYCKGADHIVQQRLREAELASEAVHKTQLDLKEFSVDGLRTLLFTRKSLSESEVQGFREEFQTAEALIDGRDEAVAEVCDRMERDLELLGCSAIEDRLQDGVPETIAYMLAAGIKVWVITGDKEETAINIGYSTRLLNQKMKLLKFHVTSSQEVGVVVERVVCVCVCICLYVLCLVFFLVFFFFFFVLFFFLLTYTYASSSFLFFCFF
jgi:magnesium-transporting ATPase (P-type)